MDRYARSWRGLVAFAPLRPVHASGSQSETVKKPYLYVDGRLSERTRRSQPASLTLVPLSVRETSALGLADRLLALLLSRSAAGQTAHSSQPAWYGEARPEGVRLLPGSSYSRVAPAGRLGLSVCARNAAPLGRQISAIHWRRPWNIVWFWARWRCRPSLQPLWLVDDTLRLLSWPISVRTSLCLSGPRASFEALFQWNARCARCQRASLRLGWAVRYPDWKRRAPFRRERALRFNGHGTAHPSRGPASHFDSNQIRQGPRRV